MLRFNKYLKSNKALSLIHSHLESLIKKYVDVKIIWENDSQQKKAKIFRVVIQYLQYVYLLV